MLRSTFVAIVVLGAPALTAHASGGLTVDGAGRTITHACGDGERVSIEGSAHRVTLTGSCGTVKVNGTKQVVDLEAAARIEVHGMDNAVTYQRGVEGAKQPKISRSGWRNTVTRRK